MAKRPHPNHKLIKAKEKELRAAVRSVASLERELAKLTRRKMRPGGGKPKGSGYERKIATIIVRAFRKCGIEKNDCYRTILSGGTKDQKGDLQFSSVLCKMFNYTVECKFYKQLNYNQFLVRYEKMKRSWPFKQWWEQLLAETEITKKKGLLVFRENGGLDLCAFRAGSLSDSLLKTLTSWPKIVVGKQDGLLWIVPFRKFVRAVASEYKK